MIPIEQIEDPNGVDVGSQWRRSGVPVEVWDPNRADLGSQWGRFRSQTKMIWDSDRGNLESQQS